MPNSYQPLITKVLLHIYLTVVSTISCHATPNKEKLDSLLFLTYNYIESKEFENARSTIKKIEQNPELDTSSQYFAHLSSYKGNLAYYNDNFDESIKQHNKAIRLYKSSYDSLRVAMAFRNIGMCYKQKGLYERSIDYYLQALDFFEKINSQKNVAWANNSIGNLYNTLEDYRNAESYFLAALSYWETKNELFETSKILNNLGNTAEGLKNYYNAIDYYDSSLLIKKKLGDLKPISITLNNLGEAHMGLQFLIKAKAYFDSALSIKIRINDINGQARVLNNIGKFYLETNQLENANNSLKKASTLIQQENAFNLLQENYLLQKRYYQKTGDFKQALMIDSVHDILNDSLFNTGKLGVIKKQSEYDLKLASQLKDQLTSENKDQKNKTTVSIVIGSLLTLIVPMFLLFRNHGKKQWVKNKNLEIELKPNPSFYCNNITYGKSSGNGSVLIFKVGADQNMSNMNIPRILKELPSRFFVRVHRSSYINLFYYGSHHGKTITLTNGVLLILGDAHKEVFLQKLAKFKGDFQKYEPYFEDK